MTDTGIGISQEHIERLAQPFEQIDSQHSRQHEGTGLGLALSKSLVELHGGNFSMESTLGEGTTVTFTLPSSPPVKQEKDEATEVGSEITKLANDIAVVLSAGEARMDETKSAAAKNTQPAQAQPSVEVNPSPPPMTSPSPAAGQGQAPQRSQSAPPQLPNPYRDSAA